MFVAGLHFIFEGIILPSIRQNMRNKLFALRDRLRMEFINGLEKHDIEAFNLIHEAINMFVNRLPLLNINVMVEVESAIRHDQKLKESVERRSNIMTSCKNENIKIISKELNKIIIESFVLNAGGWLIYILPLAVAMGLWKRIIGDCKKLIAVPHHNIGKIIPYTDYCV